MFAAREPRVCDTEWPRETTGDTGLVGGSNVEVGQILEPYSDLDCPHFQSPKRGMSSQLHYLAGSHLLGLPDKLEPGDSRVRTRAA